MSIFTEKINKILKEKGVSQKKLGELFKKGKSHISHILSGERPFPKKHIEKILPILGVSRDEFNSWIAADEYPKELIEKAVESIKNRKYKRKPVFTQNVDRALDAKYLSRSAFAKIIVYHQPSVNKMINQKISVAPKVIDGLSEVLEIPKDDLQAWILADKYGLTALELALTEKEKL